MANQTELLNVSDEMKYNDNVQMDNVKEQEENMYSFSSDTTEELCSSQATDACGDGMPFVQTFWGKEYHRCEGGYGRTGCDFSGDKGYI